MPACSIPMSTARARSCGPVRHREAAGCRSSSTSASALNSSPGSADSCSAPASRSSILGVNTTRHQYALDSFTVLDPENSGREYRDVMSYVEHELADALESGAPLPGPVRGRVSRQLRHFPITPQVDIRPDERGTSHVLSVTGGDRPGLLYEVARVLVGYGISVHTAFIHTLGERVEDTFLVSGPRLSSEKTVLQLEADLLAALQVA